MKRQQGRSPMDCEKTSKNQQQGVDRHRPLTHVQFSNIQRLSLRSSNLTTLSVRHISDALCNIASTNTIQRLDLTDNCNVSTAQCLTLLGDIYNTCIMCDMLVLLRAILLLSL